MFIPFFRVRTSPEFTPFSRGFFLPHFTFVLYNYQGQTAPQDTKYTDTLLYAPRVVTNCYNCKVGALYNSGNGTNKTTLIGPASTADVTLTLPAETDTLASEGTATALAIALG